LAFQSFNYEGTLMIAIPETCHCTHPWTPVVTSGFYESSRCTSIWSFGVFKGTQAVRIEFFVYIKSCQYSMFYTNKMFW